MDAALQRERIEDALSDVQLASLRETCERAGLDPEGWQVVDPLRQWAEVAAVTRRCDWMARTFDLSDTRAIVRAAEWFGLNGETIRKRLDRWSAADRERRREARKAA